MSDLDLIDYYRVLNPDKKMYTWRKKNPMKQGWLDYFLISENLTNIVESMSIKSGYRSDHSAVICEFKFNTFVRGRGLWKFNNNLLYDKQYVDKVKQHIQLVRDQYERSLDDSAFLDILLMEIRGITISHSSYKKPKKEQKEKSLILEINEIGNSNEANHAELEDKNSSKNLRKEKL